MNGSSNTVAYFPKTGSYPATRIASGTTINTDTQVAVGNANTSIIADILIRNLNTSTAVLLDVIIGNVANAENNRIQVSVPANAGNNGTVAIFSLAGSLASPLFTLDLQGNRLLWLEDTSAIISLRNKAALTADLIVTVVNRNM